MLSRKIDVDRHVEYTIKRIQSENELYLRSYAFAKLYFNISEYEQARRYVSNYLVVKPKSSEAHLLHGNILEKLGRREAALEEYRTSLDIDPKQNGLVLKVCELLASDDVSLDATRARYWCDQARLLDPQHPAVFDLRERLAAAETAGPEDVLQLFVSELENRPMDVALRVRLLHHLLDFNKLSEAYQHVSNIEEKNLFIFADHLIWYETVAKILMRYKNEHFNKTLSLTWQFWMLIVSVLDKVVSLSLDENISTSKNLSDCVRTIFNLDQTLSIAADNINSQCMEKQLAQEFLIHYRAQLCFHIATLAFKQAKKDQIKYKEAINFGIPLFLISCHSQPIELQCVWLDHSSDSTRKLAQRWHREAAFRCSQAGHILQSLARERRSTFADRVAQQCAGSWRERIYKNVFITRDQQLKIKTSYFINCSQLDDVISRLPDPNELLRYDEVAQLVHPSSLHHMIWIGLRTQPVKFRCSVFDGLQYSIKNLCNCAAETLNLLDIQAFLCCSIFCALANIEESKHLIYYNQEKPVVLPAAITEAHGTLNQTKWFSCVYKMYRNESGSDLSDIRVTLIKGIEIVRCAGTHGLDVKLLVMLANTFAQKAKLLRQTEMEYTEARAELYWKTALPLLEKMRNNQMSVNYPTKRWFEYRGKDMTPTEIKMYIEEGKLFSAVQFMKKKEHEKALQILEGLKSPYASFYQAQTYKLLADDQMSHNKESLTSEMRSQHIILLSKARDCLYLTLDRLREPSVDRKHPLNAELGTEIEKIERLLSRIDPDICANRNECDGMSDDNVSSVGSAGEHGNVNSSSYMLSSSANNYHIGNLTTTPPRHDHHTGTSYRLGGIGDMSLLNTPGRRAEARPSPERLDAQLRQMVAAKDASFQHIMEQNRVVMDAHRSLVDELRGFKEAVHGLTASVDELGSLKKSVEDLKVVVDDLQNMKEQVYEIKKDLAELKKDTNKLKSNQINDEDLYALEVEYGVDYNINAAASGAGAGASGFNPAASLYPNFPQRLQGAAAAAAVAANTLAYGAPGLYGMYPMYPPYGGLGLGQPGALPFPDGVGVHVPDFRTMGSIAQGLSHTAGLSNQASVAPSTVQLGGGISNNSTTNMNIFGKYDHSPSNLSLGNVPAAIALGTPLLPAAGSVSTMNNQAAAAAAAMSLTPIINNVAVNKVSPPPVNVVITASDPLPTATSSTQAQVLSVTIPPQHLKGNQKPHNYQIPLPASSQATFANIPSSITQTPMPVATQNLLSNVAPPVYSSLTVNSPGSGTGTGSGSGQQTHTSGSNLGLQIEKSLAQSFVTTLTPNTSSIDTIAGQKLFDFNRSSNTAEISFLEEHDPCPDFKPIIALPDEVPLTTGEENELVLFCEHAKLYRFVDKEWRERGIGFIKILQNNATGKVRILMRRDQVHKICANHFLTEDIQLTQMSKNERAYIWAANDFADENVVLEKLCVRFRTVDDAKKFATTFELAKIAKPLTTNTASKKSTLFNTPKPKSEPSTNKENSLGGFVFTSTPTFKPKTDFKPDTIDTKKTDSSKASPFLGFSFGIQQQSSPQVSTTTSDFKPVQKANESIKIATAAAADSSQHCENDDEEFVPTTEFKAVIALPDLVEVFTGEESSQVLHEVKAKLLRFESTSKEWKERGVGIFKILKEKTIRLLMRREQVHKVCCNHQLLKSMVFTNMPKNNRVLNWCAQDFAEGILRTEMFAIRFRTPELCEEFLQMIHKAQDMLDTSNNVTSSGASLPSSGAAPATTEKNKTSTWGKTFKMKEGSWECSACYVNNDGKSNMCIACGTTSRSGSYSTDANESNHAQSPQKFKPSPMSTVQPIKDNKPKIGTWQCKTCYMHNDGKNKNCDACDTPKSDSVTVKKDEFNVSGQQQFSFGVPSPGFGSLQLAAMKPIGGSTAMTTTATLSWGDLYKPKTGTWNCNGCYLSNDGSAIYCAACDAPKDNTIPKKENTGLDLGNSTGQTFSFGIPSAQSKLTTPSTITAAAAATPTTESTIFGFKSQPSAGFTFGMTPQSNAATTTPNTGFTFGGPQSSATNNIEITTASTPLNLAAKPTFTFTMSANNTSSTNNIPPNESLAPGKNEEFVFGSPNKHEFEFKPRSPRKVSGGEDDSDGSGVEEECDHIYFKPLVPLPDKIEVFTGEEDEQVLYCQRAKLFRFADSEWKERGVGDVKILKNSISGRLRVLMRRDQVYKICLNHILTVNMEYLPMNEKAWLFSATDYSDGEIVQERFCLRFKDSEVAKQFMDTVNKVRNGSTTAAAPTPTDRTNNDSMCKQNSDIDIEIVYETKVSTELQEKALALKLPKNFYAYLDKPPCTGCIGCNDDNFIFASTKSIVAKPKTEFIFGQKSMSSTPAPSVTKPDTLSTSSNNSGNTISSSIFGTPETTNIFSGSSTLSKPKLETPISIGSTFNFTHPGSGTGINSKVFLNPFNFASTTSTTNNMFSITPTLSSNLFAGSGSMTFGQTTITPVQSNYNNSPALTSLLLAQSHDPTVATETSISYSEQHKSPLAPSKLANALCVSTTQSSSIFSGTPPVTTTTTIFGGIKSQNSENLLPSTQILTPTTTTNPIFGGSIFGGAKTGVTTTPIFGASNQFESSINSGNTTAAIVTKQESLFSNTAPNMFGGGGGVVAAVFGSNSQPLFGGALPISQKIAAENIQQTINSQNPISIFGNLSTTAPTFGSLAATNKPTETTITENKSETKSFSFNDTKDALVFSSDDLRKETDPLLACDTNLSFASLATGAQQAPAFVPSSPNEEVKPFTFAGAGSQVFANKKTNKQNTSKTDKKTDKVLNKSATETEAVDAGEDGGAEAAEGVTEEYDPHYEPIVPLPDAIVVKTGEEDESITFNERAKLYRFSADTKEWKERGVGQIKILHHPDNDTYRILLRREQVHKLVLNQLITVDMELQAMQTSDRAWLWAGFNHSEDGSQLEKLAVRFKHAEMAIQFHDAVVAAQDYLRTRPPQATTAAIAETTDYGDDDDDDDQDVDEEEDEEYGSDESDENK